MGEPVRRSVEEHHISATCQMYYQRKGIYIDVNEDMDGV